MLTVEQNIQDNADSFAEILDEARRQLDHCDGDEIVVDCSAITVIHSFMLNRLIRLHLDARRSGVPLVLENVDDLVLKVITLTRLDRMFRIRFDQRHTTPPRMHHRSPARSLS